MNFLSRKFLVFILLTVIFWGALITTALLTAGVVDSLVFIVVVIADTLLGIAYIGGNVWQKIIQTAQIAVPELLKKE